MAGRRLGQTAERGQGDRHVESRALIGGLRFLSAGMAPFVSAVMGRLRVPGQSFVAGLACSVALALLGAAEVTAAYPERPIRLLVGFPAGGGADFTARLVSSELSGALGQQVIVDNRPGANGAIAADMAAKARPDGYTLLLIPFNFALAPAITPKLPFDPEKDFSAVSLVVSAPMVLSAHPGLSATSVADLVQLARREPGTIKFGSGGPGSTSHVAGELLMSISDVRLVHVPYRGASPAMAATISGEVDLYFGSLPVLLPQGKAGRLRLLGISSAQRARAAPDLPTLSESGVRGYEFATWYGVVAPRGTSEGIRRQLQGEIKAMLGKPSVQAQLAKGGAEPVGSDPEAFGRYLVEEIRRWKRILRSNASPGQ